MLERIPGVIDAFGVWVTKKTDWFVETTVGKLFLGLVLVGPLTFIPTLIEAWTAENIDALRTSTWPTATVVNLSAWLAVLRSGDWRMKFVMGIWTVWMALITLATVVR